MVHNHNCAHERFRNQPVPWVGVVKGTPTQLYAVATVKGTIRWRLASPRHSQVIAAVSRDPRKGTVLVVVPQIPVRLSSIYLHIRIGGELHGCLCIPVSTHEWTYFSVLSCVFLPLAVYGEFGRPVGTWSWRLCERVKKSAGGGDQDGGGKESHDESWQGSVDSPVLCARQRKRVCV